MVTTRYIRAKCVNISKTIGDASKLLLMINRKLHIRFPLAPTSMTLDDLELFEVRIYGEKNFADLAGTNE